MFFPQICSDSLGSSCSHPSDNPEGEACGDQTGAVPAAAADSPQCRKQDRRSSELEIHLGSLSTATSATTTIAQSKSLISNPGTECAAKSSLTVNPSDANMTTTSRPDYSSSISSRPSEHLQTMAKDKEKEEQDQHHTPGSPSQVPQQHGVEECHPSTIQLPDREWSISFEQFLANVANEENLVRFFEQQVNVAEEVQKLRTRNTISPSASGSVASSPT